MRIEFYNIVFLILLIFLGVFFVENFSDKKKIVQAIKSEEIIYLDDGWNLVSLPEEMEGMTIEGTREFPEVWYYNNEENNYYVAPKEISDESGYPYLDKVEAGEVYWVKSAGKNNLISCNPLTFDGDCGKVFPSKTEEIKKDFGTKGAGGLKKQIEVEEFFDFEPSFNFVALGWDSNKQEWLVYVRDKKIDISNYSELTKVHPKQGYFFGKKISSGNSVGDVFEAGDVFVSLIDDNKSDWRDILKVESFTTRIDSKSSDIKHAPTFFIEKGESDFEGLSRFLKDYNTSRIILLSDKEVNSNLNSVLADYDVVKKSIDNIYDNQDNYDSLVLVEKDDYETALMASVVASYKNSFLVFIDSDKDCSDYGNWFNGKKVYVYGDLKDNLPVCINKLTVEQESKTLKELQEWYRGETNTDKLVLVNTDDLNDTTVEGLSLISPLLAAVKKEIIINIDQEKTSKSELKKYSSSDGSYGCEFDYQGFGSSSYSSKALSVQKQLIKIRDRIFPEKGVLGSYYSIVIAEPTMIIDSQPSGGKQDPNSGFCMDSRYSIFTGDGAMSGRIYGDFLDVNVYIERAINYQHLKNQIYGSNKKEAIIIAPPNSPSLNYRGQAESEIYSSLLNKSDWEVSSFNEYEDYYLVNEEGKNYELSSSENKNLISYFGHGSPGGWAVAGCSDKLDLPVVFSGACLTDSYWDGVGGDTLGVKLLKAGAIAHFGALSIDMNNFNIIKENILELVNNTEITLGKITKGLPQNYSLIGDPTIKPFLNGLDGKKCDSSNLSLCVNQSDCENVGGNWCLADKKFLCQSSNCEIDLEDNNKKNLSNYKENEVFVVFTEKQGNKIGSNNNWNNVLQTVPMTVWNSDSAGKPIAYPTMVISEGMNYDSFRDFVEKYKPSMLTILHDDSVNIMEKTSIMNVLSTFSHSDIQTKSFSDIYSYWDNFDSLILVDKNDYETALMASVVASYKNIPIKFVDKNSNCSEYSNLIKDKKVYVYGSSLIDNLPICIGDISSIVEKKDLEGIQSWYKNETKTDKLLLVNPIDNLNNNGMEYEYNLSLLAPFLASAKNELLGYLPLDYSATNIDQCSSGYSDDVSVYKESVSARRAGEIALIDDFFPEIKVKDSYFRTIVASPRTIPDSEFSGCESFPGYEDSAHRNGIKIKPLELNSRYNTNKKGRIYGDFIDTSVYIARSVGYDRLRKELYGDNNSSANILEFNSADEFSGIDKRAVEDLDIFLDDNNWESNLFNTSIHKMSFAGMHNMNENSSMIVYVGHGTSNGWASANIGDQLKTPFVVGLACLTNQYWPGGNPFGVYALQQGAIAYYGALSITNAWSFNALDFCKDQLKFNNPNVTIGDFSKCLGQPDYEMLGDPTIKLNF